MRLSTPHLGNVYMLLSDLFSRLGVEYLPPPPTTERTVRLGVAVAPEFACLPLKVTIGNLIEALEQGADTLLMAGGVGPCRFGYYAEIQKRVLKELGYSFDFITLEPPGAGIRQFVGTLRRLAPDCSYLDLYRKIRACLDKAVAVDYLERHSFEVRPYEMRRGDTTKALNRATEILAGVAEGDDLPAAEREATGVLDRVEQDASRDPIRIGLIGEFYILLEPFFKFDVERWLGERGCVVDRGIYLTDWIRPSSANPVAGVSAERIAELAYPYLKHSVGGDGLASIGHAVHYAREGFDGVMHLLPFTCMPDTIAKALLTRVAADHDIPILSLVIDEQTGKAGIHTRLEAFLDLVRSRRDTKDQRPITNHQSPITV